MDLHQLRWLGWVGLLCTAITWLQAVDTPETAHPGVVLSASAHQALNRRQAPPPSRDPSFSEPSPPLPTMVPMVSEDHQEVPPALAHFSHSRAGFVLASPRRLCSRWARGSETAPDESTVIQDGETALRQLWPLLLSHADPLMQAIGLYGSQALEPLVLQASMSNDPRVVAVAMFSCMRASYRMPSLDKNGLVTGHARLPCIEQTARRWTELAPDNAAAWLTLATIAREQGRSELATYAMDRMAQAPAWNSYRGLMLAKAMEVMPPEFSWWQRRTIGARLMEPTYLSLDGIADDYCSDAATQRSAERRQRCTQLASTLSHLSQDANAIAVGLRLGRQMELPETDEQLDLDLTLYFSQQERQFWWERQAMSEESHCQQSVQQLYQHLRSYYDGGDLSLLREDASKARRRMQRRSLRASTSVEDMDTWVE
jgi:hypothetical protein